MPQTRTQARNRPIGSIRFNPPERDKPLIEKWKITTGVYLQEYSHYFLKMKMVIRGKVSFDFLDSVETGRVQYHSALRIGKKNVQGVFPVSGVETREFY
jgi:hypothetical protein